MESLILLVLFFVLLLILEGEIDVYYINKLADVPHGLNAFQRTAISAFSLFMYQGRFEPWLLFWSICLHLSVWWIFFDPYVNLRREERMPLFYVGKSANTDRLLRGVSTTLKLDLSLTVILVKSSLLCVVYLIFKSI